MTRKDITYLIIIFILILSFVAAGIFLVLNSDKISDYLEDRQDRIEASSEESVAREKVEILLEIGKEDGLVTSWKYEKEIDGRGEKYDILVVKVDGDEWKAIGSDEQKSFSITVEKTLFDFTDHTALRIIDAKTDEIYIRGLGPMYLQ